MSKNHSAKEIYFTFFTKIDEKMSECNLCKNHCSIPIKTSYTNAKIHMSTNHQNYEELMKEKQLTGSMNNQTLDRFCLNNVSSEAIDIYKWLELIVLRNEPFSIVEDPLMRAFGNIQTH